MPGKAVKCLACRHYCIIPPNQTGICGVRQNDDGKLNLLVYGRAAGAAVDPIEKKPLYHFFPGTKIFSLGTIGCNFGCTFCQNWDTSQASKEFRNLALKGQIGPQDLKAAITESGFDLPPKKIIEYCLKHQIKAIAYTYNEPSIFFEYTYDTAKLAKKHGIHNVYVTNGYTSPEALDKLEGLLDAANIDLKSFSDKFYRDITKAKLSEVLKSIEYYYKKGIWLEITTLVIPGKNDSSSELTKIAEFIAGIDVNIPWHISRFTPHYLMQDVAMTGKEKLLQAFNIGKKAGLNYVYVGNIFDEKLHSTYCPKCSKLLVERDWDHVKIKALKKGKCQECGLNIKGVWN